ncbi:transmembrane protein 62-like [Acropora millepora]|uniref:transmembrane protein 62-like n=1 Tax=Acropora millepora TaxID=45264 RepID=UPI001CF2D79C|nr:transmembrane protein 62-like [Acropora millepora]
MAIGLRGVLSFILLLIILSLSWLVAVLLDYYTGYGVSLKPHKRTNSAPFPNDKLENLFWFVQISDIHISKYRAHQRAYDLQQFCNENIDVIQPVTVLATGDLTDAKDAYKLGSMQYKEEWEVYHNVLKETQVEKKTKWIDLRGNHDAFDVPSLSGAENFFKDYSMTGPEGYKGSKPYQYVYHTKYGSYAFNGIDFNPDPGPKRPFNFFGHVDQERINAMEKLADTSNSFNMTIWFGHHPFSVTTTPSVRKILRSGAVYLCGHLHTLAEVVPRMYAVHTDGHLELELGDWLDTRNYRVLAIDHDIFSFVDVRLNTWPIILITNPKDAHYVMPPHEPLGRMRKSTHIRFLAFSPAPIASATVEIDGSIFSNVATHVKGPLFVCQWNPDVFSTGIHSITVKVKDTAGRISARTQLFSLDGSRPTLDLIPAFLLLTDFFTLGRVLFFAYFTLIVLGLAFMRRCHPSSYQGVLLCGLLSRWWNRLVLLALTDSLFYPLFFFGVYTAIGPWFVGEMMQGHIGVLFVHGMYLKQHWIPGSLSYYYGLMQLVLLNLPLTLYLAYFVEVNNRASVKLHRKSLVDSIFHGSLLGFLQRSVGHFVFFFALLWQMSSCYNLLYTYGVMSFLVSPAKTWSIALMLYLFWKVHRPVQK